MINEAYLHRSFPTFFLLWIVEYLSDNDPFAGLEQVVQVHFYSCRSQVLNLLLPTEIILVLEPRFRILGIIPPLSVSLECLHL